MCFGEEKDKEGALTNKKITETLKKDQRKFENTISLLLLGAGESGKTTVLKQFKILHMNGFTPEELADFKSDIRVNVLQAIGGLTRVALANRSGIRADLVKSAETFSRLDEYNTPLTPELASSIRVLWNDPAIRDTYTKRVDKQLQSNASYLLDEVERVASPVFVPTETDVLCCRVRTTGCLEIKFTIDDVPFKLMDVGGQRSERKKWVNFFDDITALMYVVALDEYDLKLFEDASTNRMLESLRLFEEMINHPVFAKTAIILFLNKKDLLKDKLDKVGLNTLFPEYKGGASYKEAGNFIRAKYLSLNQTGKTIYTHFTCATSTKNIEKVFEDVRHSVLVGTLAGAGVI